MLHNRGHEESPELLRTRDSAQNSYPQLRCTHTQVRSTQHPVHRCTPTRRHSGSRLFLKAHPPTLCAAW